MFNLGLRKFYLVLLVTYCFFGQFTDALRCYQCKYGNNVLCNKNDVVTVTCPSTNTQSGASNSVNNCGYAQVKFKVSGKTADFATFSSLETLTWRGCVNSGAGVVGTTDFSFSFLSLGATVATTQGIVAASYTACSSSSDLCNKPRSCYRCAYSWTGVCNSFDTVLDECYELTKIYCSSLVVTSPTFSCSSGTCYWKGCLSSSDVSTLTGTYTPATLSTIVANANGIRIGLAAAEITNNIASFVTTSVNYCSTDGCNGASQFYTMFNLSIMIAALLFHLIF